MILKGKIVIFKRNVNEVDIQGTQSVKSLQKYWPGLTSSKISRRIGIFLKNVADDMKIALVKPLYI